MSIEDPGTVVPRLMKLIGHRPLPNDKMDAPDEIFREGYLAAMKDLKSGAISFLTGDTLLIGGYWYRITRNDLTGVHSLVRVADPK